MGWWHLVFRPVGPVPVLPAGTTVWDLLGPVAVAAVVVSLGYWIAGYIAEARR